MLGRWASEPPDTELDLDTSARFRARLVTLEDQRRHLAGRLEAAEAKLALQGAQAVRSDAVRRFCAELVPRLEALGRTPEGRRFVLGKCVDRVVWRGGKAEIDAILPVWPETVTSIELIEPPKKPAVSGGCC